MKLLKSYGIEPKPGKVVERPGLICLDCGNLKEHPEGSMIDVCMNPDGAAIEYNPILFYFLDRIFCRNWRPQKEE